MIFYPQVNGGVYKDQDTKKTLGSQPITKVTWFNSVPNSNKGTKNTNNVRSHTNTSAPYKKEGEEKMLTDELERSSIQIMHRSKNIIRRSDQIMPSFGVAYTEKGVNRILDKSEPPFEKMSNSEKTNKELLHRKINNSSIHTSDSNTDKLSLRSPETPKFKYLDKILTNSEKEMMDSIDKIKEIINNANKIGEKIPYKKQNFLLI
jgi:hypothetical protein